MTAPRLRFLSHIAGAEYRMVLLQTREDAGNLQLRQRTQKREIQHRRLNIPGRIPLKVLLKAIGL